MEELALVCGRRTAGADFNHSLHRQQQQPAFLGHCLESWFRICCVLAHAPNGSARSCQVLLLISTQRQNEFHLSAPHLISSFATMCPAKRACASTLRETPFRLTAKARYHCVWSEFQDAVNACLHESCTRRLQRTSPAVNDCARLAGCLQTCAIPKDQQHTVFCNTKAALRRARR